MYDIISRVLSIIFYDNFGNSMLNYKTQLQKSISTSSLGASSTTSAGWPAPMLAKHAPLQLIYFCILFATRITYKANRNKNKNNNNNKLCKQIKATLIPMITKK